MGEVGDGGNYLVSVTNIFVPSLVLLFFSNHCLRLPRTKKKIGFAVFSLRKLGVILYFHSQQSVPSLEHFIYSEEENMKSFSDLFLNI